MFLIGFLSSPVPLVLLAFFYLLMFSYGHFAKKDFSKVEENVQAITLTSELNQEQNFEQHEACNYFAFVQDSNKQSKTDHYNNIIDVVDYPPLIQPFKILLNTSSPFCHWPVALSNRPPPLA